MVATLICVESDGYGFTPVWRQADGEGVQVSADVSGTPEAEDEGEYGLSLAHLNRWEDGVGFDGAWFGLGESGCQDGDRRENRYQVHPETQLMDLVKRIKNK